MASIEELSGMLDKLEMKEKKKEAEQDDLNRRLKNTSSADAESKILDLLKTVSETVLSIQQERREIVHLMTLQVEKGGVVDSPRKKVRRSLPPPTSASKWTFQILEDYAMHFLSIYELDQFLYQAAPTVSDRAKRFTEICASISPETLMKMTFPDDPIASWFAKQLFLISSTRFGNIEASVDDMMLILLNSLGFNDGDLICASRNRLTFKMSQRMVCADADITVFNLKTMIRLAVVEDKRWDPTLGRSQSGEPQLIGEAIAAAMHNESLISSARRAISEPPTTDCPSTQTLPMPAPSTSDGLIFMTRVCGSSMFFYSTKFNSGVLKSVAEGVEVPIHTTIRKFMVTADDPKFDGLSLLFAEERSMIFRILDSIQQIISRW